MNLGKSQIIKNKKSQRGIVEATTTLRSAPVPMKANNVQGGKFHPIQDFTSPDTIKMQRRDGKTLVVTPPSMRVVPNLRDRVVGGNPTLSIEEL